MRRTPQENNEPGLHLRRRLHRLAVAASGVVVLGIAAAACGGSPASPGVATGSTTTTAASSSAGGSTHATGLLAYSACMRSHGVTNFPDPDSTGGIPKPAAGGALSAVSSSLSKAASNDCEHLLPAGGSLGGQPTHVVTAKDQRYYLNAVACMHAHGFATFPDPVFSGGSVNLPIPSSINQNSPQFVHAAQICTKLIPAGLPKG
jgi:hypothetical protein